MVLKLDGRDLKKLCIEANASIAVPSTTSITPSPYRFGISGAALTATAPPILWPTRIIGASCAIASIIAATSLDESCDVFFVKRNKDFLKISIVYSPFRRLRRLNVSRA